MKKLLAFLLSLLLLVGCQSDEPYDYTGSYALITNGGYTHLVVHWEFPDPDFNYSTFEIDYSNIESYIDESITGSGPGLVLQNLLGSLGFNRAFLNVQPIKISEANVNKIISKDIRIYMTIQDENGNSYRIRLKYDKSIKA